MPSLNGTHTQWSTKHVYSYWASYDLVGSHLHYSACISDGDKLLASPDAKIFFHSWNATPEEVARAHVIRYIDNTDFIEPRPPGKERKASPLQAAQHRS